MVRHEVDDHLEPVCVAAPDQLLELCKPVSGVQRIVRADVEVVLDGIRAAGDAFQKIRIIRGPAWIGGATRLLQHTGQPEVGEAHLFEGNQRGRGDVGKFSAAVLRERAVGFPGLVGVAEGADHELVNHGPGRVGRMTAV